MGVLHVDPLAASAALAVIKVIDRDGLVVRAAELGRMMRDGFGDALDSNPAVKSIRGHGLMLGIELDRPCADLVKLALDDGLLLNVAADSVVRLLPPLIMSNEEARKVVSQVVRLVSNFIDTPS